MLNKQSADCSGENLFSISNIIPIELSNIELTGWEAKRLKGCIFSPPSLLPVPGRGKEARKHNLSIASNTVSVLFLLKVDAP